MCGAVDDLAKATRLPGIEEAVAEGLVDGLSSDVNSMSRCEHVYDRAFHGRQGDSFMLADVRRLQICMMDRYPFGVLATQAGGLRNGEMDARWIQVGETIDEQSSLMGECDMLLGAMMTCLGPQDGLAVLSEAIRGIMSNSVDPSVHSLQPAALRQPGQDRISNP